MIGKVLKELPHGQPSCAWSTAIKADLSLFWLRAGTVDSNVGSGYFVCAPELLDSSATEQFIVVKPAESQTPAVGEEDAAFEVASKKEDEEIDFAREIDSCTTQLHELSKLDWMEPRPTGARHQLLEYEGNELESSSNIDAYASEIKAALEKLKKTTETFAIFLMMQQLKLEVYSVSL